MTLFIKNRQILKNSNSRGKLFSH